jgi:hypothetical protein
MAVDPAPIPYEPAPPVTKRGVLPTAKLVSAAVTMVLLYLLRLVVDVDEELEQIVNLVVPLLVAYFVPNSDTPGGVPDARPQLRDEAGYSDVALIALGAVLAIAVIVAIAVL